MQKDHRGAPSIRKTPQGGFYRTIFDFVAISVMPFLCLLSGVAKSFAMQFLNCVNHDYTDFIVLPRIDPYEDSLGAESGDCYTTPKDVHAAGMTEKL